MFGRKKQDLADAGGALPGVPGLAEAMAEASRMVGVQGNLKRLPEVLLPDERVTAVAYAQWLAQRDQRGERARGEMDLSGIAVLTNRRLLFLGKRMNLAANESVRLKDITQVRGSRSSTMTAMTRLEVTAPGHTGAMMMAGNEAQRFTNLIEHLRD